MIKKLILGAAIGALAFGVASISQAATLTVVGGETTSLASNFDLEAETGLSNGSSSTASDVQVFDGKWWTSAPNTTSSNSLQLSGAPASLRFTYLGSEAGSVNKTFSSESGSLLLFDTNSLVGTSVTVATGSDGAVPFYFENASGQHCILFCSDEQASNDDGIDGWLFGGLSLAFFQENASSVIALFGDGAGDSDLDDMAIRISVVPLPPSMVLFGAALIGLGVISRRKKQQKAV